jgi:PAS domain S-box-containing protein
LLIKAGREPLIISDTSQHPVTSQMDITQDLNIKSFLGVPIFLKNGELFGNLYALDIKFYTFSNEEITLMETMAKFLSYVIELDESNERMKNDYERLSHQYELILNSIDEGIYGLDIEGKTTFLNQATVKMTGFQEEEMLGMHQHSILHHSRADGVIYPADECPILLSIKQGTIQHVTDEVFWRKDGSFFLVEYVSTPIFEKGEIIGGVVTFRDITEVKKTQELMLNSEKLSVAGQLAAGIAHEIRNPLTAIKGFLKLLGPDFGDKKHYIDIMLAEMERIELILSELLVLAKPQPVKSYHGDLRELLEHVTTLLSTEGNLYNIEIKTEFDVDLPQMEFDENQLKQVFVNFIKNAMEAMPDGGEICIQVKRKDEKLIIRFIDQGCGIPENTLKKIGEPFFTTKETGTGLGFMISKKIIEAHGGNLRITSKLNEGTTIEVAFPVSIAENGNI